MRNYTLQLLMDGIQVKSGQLSARCGLGVKYGNVGLHDSCGGLFDVAGEPAPRVCHCPHHAVAKRDLAVSRINVLLENPELLAALDYGYQEWRAGNGVTLEAIAAER